MVSSSKALKVSFLIVSNDTTIISTGSILGIQGNSLEECKANAQLIAASPEMYELLHEAYKYIYEQDRFHPLIEQIAELTNKIDQ